MIAAPPDLSKGRRLTSRQERLLADLEGIILSEGFDHLTVGDLAERLQCSRRTLYAIAESRDELVLLAIDRVLRRVAHSAHEEVRKHDDPLARLRAFLHGGLVELRSATLTFSADVASHGAARRLVEGHFRYAASLAGQLIEEGIDAGVFREVHAGVVAEMIDAGIERLQDPEVLKVAGLTFAEALDEFLAVVVEGLIVAPRRL